MIFNNRVCNIPLSVLYASPYNLAQGTAIGATVVAINSYGSSQSSLVGTGGVVVLVPFQPTALVNNAAVTTDTVIGITWTASANGGTAVLYYSVYFDQGQGTETYVLLSSPISITSFTTSTTLIPGTTYKFYVTATNSVGTSAPSSVLSVLAAKVPDAPLGPYNDAAVTTGYQVGLTWSTTNVYNGGSPVIDYAVYYSS